MLFGESRRSFVCGYIFAECRRKCFTSRAIPLADSLHQAPPLLLRRCVRFALARVLPAPYLRWVVYYLLCTKTGTSPAGSRVLTLRLCNWRVFCPTPGYATTRVCVCFRAIFYVCWFPTRLRVRAKSTLNRFVSYALSPYGLVFYYQGPRVRYCIGCRANSTRGTHRTEAQQTSPAPRASAVQTGAFTGLAFRRPMVSPWSPHHPSFWRPRHK